jgi:hypothetical protein
MSEKPPYWQRPLTEEELERIEVLAAESKPISDFAAALLERWALHGSYGKDLPTPEDALVAVVRHLVYEVRRLRQLVIDAEPYVPDNEQTRTMDLPARLRAEKDR